MARPSEEKSRCRLRRHGLTVCRISNDGIPGQCSRQRSSSPDFHRTRDARSRGEFGLAEGLVMPSARAGLCELGVEALARYSTEHKRFPSGRPVHRLLTKRTCAGCRTRSSNCAGAGQPINLIVSRIPSPFRSDCRFQWANFSIAFSVPPFSSWRLPLRRGCCCSITPGRWPRWR